MSIRIPSVIASSRRLRGDLFKKIASSLTLLAMTLCPLLSSFAYADVTTGLVGWWRFEEGSGTTAVDSSGNGNTGTLTNGPTFTTSCGRGGCVSFDGSDDYVDIADSASLNPVYALTLSAWVYTTSSTTAQQVIAKYNSNINSREYWLSIGDSSTAGIVYVIVSADGVGSNTSRSSKRVNNGQWHHVAMTFSATGFAAPNIYIDGVLDNGGGTSALNNIGALYNGTARVAISSTISGAGTRVQYFDGKIDDVRVYNRALTAADIQLLYQGSRLSGATISGARLDN